MALIFCIGIAKISCSISWIGKLSSPHKAYAILIGDMKGGNNPFGYTIVEVLIVMAVSGFMFVIAANFINGKQERTSFQVASNEMASRIQEVIDQVSNGEYTDIPFTCSVNGSNLKFAAGGGPGTNDTCVFLGKVVRLAEAGERNKYEVFSIAGTREASGAPVSGIGDSTLTAISGVGVDVTKHQTTPQNVDVIKTKVIDTTGGTHDDNIYAIAFVLGYGSTTTSPGGAINYNSGSQTVSFYYVDNISAGTSEPNVISKINQGGVPNSGANFKFAQSACLLISDGRRAAQINIGAGQNSQLSVELKQLGVAASPTC